MPAPPTMTGSSSWISATPRLPPAALRPSAVALLVGGVEEVDVGHRRGEVAAADASSRGDQAEHPVGRRRVLHGDREEQRRDQQQDAADDGPVAAAELRHRERVGQPQQRADQVGQRDQQEELLRGEREALRQQERRRDAPDQPDREADVLGEDRPDRGCAGRRARPVVSQNSVSSGRQSSIQRRLRRVGVCMLMTSSVVARCDGRPAAAVAESSHSPHGLTARDARGAPTRIGRGTIGPFPPAVERCTIPRDQVRRGTGSSAR